METATNKQKYIWNMVGSFANALSSMVLAIIVNRLAGVDMGGVFAFAFSNAQLMLTIGQFEVRPLQSTDVNEKYSFKTYFTLRIMTSIIMIIVDLLFIYIRGYTGVKAWTVFFVCVYKMIEGITDVFAGMFQQHDRIDLSGKAFTLRIVLCTVMFGLVLFVSDNLVIASATMGIVSAVLIFVYDLRLWKGFKNVRIGIDFGGISGLIIDCFPLFISAFINMYINNAPKYAIERYYADSIQNIYNILFMPAFVINLFSLFVFRPMLTDLTREWNEYKIKPFVGYIRKMLILIVLFTVLAMAGAYVLGIPVLGIIYGVDISDYRPELVLIMVTGGISAIVTFLYYVITVMRRQKYLLIGYFCGFVMALLLPKILVKKYEVKGAVYSCAASMIILAAAFGIIVMLSILKYGKEASDERVVDNHSGL